MSIEVKILKRYPFPVVRAAANYDDSLPLTVLPGDCALPRRIINMIMDFAFAPWFNFCHVSKPVCLETWDEEEAMAHNAMREMRCRQYDETLGLAMERIKHLGTAALSSGSSFRLGDKIMFSDGDLYCEDELSSLDDEIDPQSSASTYIATYERHFKICFRCREFPNSYDESAVDVWCSATAQSSADSTARFTARAWFVIASYLGDMPVAVYLAPKFQCFTMSWTPGCGIVLNGFDVRSMMRHAGLTGFDECFWGIPMSLDAHTNLTFDKPVEEASISRDLIFPIADEVSHAKSKPDCSLQSEVVQAISHADDAAQIHADEAAMQVSEQRDSWIQHNPVPLGSATDDHDDPAIGEDDADVDVQPRVQLESIYLLRLTRHPRELQTALQQCKALQEARVAMEDASQDLCLPSGASVFVQPHLYDAVLDAVARESLRPYHIVVTEALYETVVGCVRSLRARLDTRVRDVKTVGYVLADDEDIVVVEKRTFLDVHRSLRRAESVVQSTTEAHNARNPRRHIPP